MMFHFDIYDKECGEFSDTKLQQEWKHYTNVISASATTNGISCMAFPFTIGASGIGIAITATLIHDARKKREILEKHFRSRDLSPETRKRDIMNSVAKSATIGSLALLVGVGGAEQIYLAGAEHGVSAIAENKSAIKAGVHVGTEAAVLTIEHEDAKKKRKKQAEDDKQGLVERRSKI